MHSADRTVTKYIRAAPVVAGRRPAVPVQHQTRLNSGTISFTKAGTGPAVLLIHGLGSTSQTWRHLLPGLARTHTVIAPDLPGHGLSGPPAGGFSLGAHACTMRDLLLTLGLSRASIIGHGLGGGIALQSAYQFPERTERVALISAGGLGADVAPILRAAALPGADTVVAALSSVPAGLTRRLFALLPVLVGSSDGGVLAGTLRGLTDDNQRHAFLHTARTVTGWHRQTAGASCQLGLLSDVPMLFAWGADDRAVLPKHHHAFARRVRHAMTVEIADAGHYPHETAPAQLLSALQTFLAATQPYRYVEDRWVRRLVCARPTGAGLGPPGKTPTTDEVVTH